MGCGSSSPQISQVSEGKKDTAVGKTGNAGRHASIGQSDGVTRGKSSARKEENLFDDITVRNPNLVKTLKGTDLIASENTTGKKEHHVGGKQIEKSISLRENSDQVVRDGDMQTNSTHRSQGQDAESLVTQGNDAESLATRGKDVESLATQVTDSVDLNESRDHVKDVHNSRSDKEGILCHKTDSAVCKFKDEVSGSDVGVVDDGSLEAPTKNHELETVLEDGEDNYDDNEGVPTPSGIKSEAAGNDQLSSSLVRHTSVASEGIPGEHYNGVSPTRHEGVCKEQLAASLAALATTQFGVDREGDQAHDGSEVRMADAESSGLGIRQQALLAEDLAEPQHVALGAGDVSESRVYFGVKNDNFVEPVVERDTKTAAGKDSKPNEEFSSETMALVNDAQIEMSHADDNIKGLSNSSCFPNGNYAEQGIESTRNELRLNPKSLLNCRVQEDDGADGNASSSKDSGVVSSDGDKTLRELNEPTAGVAKDVMSQEANQNAVSEESSNQVTPPVRDHGAENRLTIALRLLCKFSPWLPIEKLHTTNITSLHLMRSLPRAGISLAELLRRLTNLTELDLSGNMLGPQGFRVVCLAVARNSTLKSLNLANNAADTDSSECLGKMLSSNRTLVKLDVSGNDLGKDYFSRCVGPALRKNESLKVLKCSSCGANDLTAICETLSAPERKSALEELDASNNHVGAAFGEGLERLLKTPGCSLMHLDVHGTGLQREGMAALLAGVRENKSLLSLNAAGHQVSSLSFLMSFLHGCVCHPSLEELNLGGTVVNEQDDWKPRDAATPQKNSNIAKLHLSGCSLTDEALRTLSEITRGRLPSLCQLDVSSNEQLTSECLSSISNMISVSGQCGPVRMLDFSLNNAEGFASELDKFAGLKSLEVLLLKKSKIAPASVISLSKVITMTETETGCISSLTLDGVKLSGTDALKGMLGLSDTFLPTVPCGLDYLSLIGCALNDKDVKPLLSAFGRGLRIKELKLSANRLTDTSVSYLVDSEGMSLSLQSLDLSINKIRTPGAEKLAKALSNKLSNLRILSLANNCIGKAGLLCLVSAVGPMRQLEVLNLKSQQQPMGEEDMDEIMEQLANALGFEPEGITDFPQHLLNLSPTFTVNLSGLGGEPGELGPKLDSLAIQTDYSSQHRRTLTLSDAIQLSAALCGKTEPQMNSADWNQVISADKDAPTWLQVASRRQCAIYVTNLPLIVTAEKLEGLLDSEAECNVAEVYLMKDQILRKPNGLAWVLFTDMESVQRALDFYDSAGAVMYGTPFVISSINVNISADTGEDESAESRARQDMVQRTEDRKIDQTAHAQLVQSNYDESRARHDYSAQHPAYADGRVW